MIVLVVLRNFGWPSFYSFATSISVAWCDQHCVCVCASIICDCACLPGRPSESGTRTRWGSSESGGWVVSSIGPTGRRTPPPSAGQGHRSAAGLKLLEQLIFGPVAGLKRAAGG
eukprot:GHVU01065261.1.p1 GENE.GHVU01065261.1~~GHVU01065261.1.p1  ORF type:complete len:114 (+),score=4.74 GHVU01065261.1:38-379(+)